MSKRRRTKRSAASLLLSLAIVAVILVAVYFAISKASQEEIPESIMEVGRKYPEAMEYVEGYERYKDADLSMDVTEEMAERAIPLFIQWDKRWGYKSYGQSYIGVSGCGPTSLAMVVCGLTGNADINPYVVAKYASDAGFYTYGQGTSWSLMTEGAYHYGIEAYGGTNSPDFILDNLSEDTPMICSVKPGDFTYSGHFIVLSGIDEDGLIIVNDPNSRNNSNKHWDVNTLVGQIKAIWVYRR